MCARRPGLSTRAGTPRTCQECSLWECRRHCGIRRRYDRKASAAAAEECRLQAEVEEYRAEGAKLQARAEEVERRTRDSAAAAQECERLRDELEAVTEERRVALERQRVAEADARDARHETERLQEEVGPSCVICLCCLGVSGCAVFYRAVNMDQSSLVAGCFSQTAAHCMLKHSVRGKTCIGPVGSPVP